MIRTLRVQAPAKVNLYLQVTGKRPDGFHELDTLFEAIDTHDTLTFREAPSGIRLSTNRSTLPTGPKNLVYRAAQLLKDECGVRSGVRIHLQKELPIASGVGGGSSDAATTLLALNRLWKLGLKEEKLLKLAGKFGSDISFFVLQSAFAIGRGRGEELERVASKMRLWHVLVTPRLEVLAKDAYGRLKPSWLKRSGVGARMLARSLKKCDYGSTAAAVFNTLEFSVLDMHPSLERIKRNLIAGGADTAAVSGSGPTVFGLVDSRKRAAALAARMRKNHRACWVQTAATANL